MLQVLLKAHDLRQFSQDFNCQINDLGDSLDSVSKLIQIKQTQNVSEWQFR